MQLSTGDCCVARAGARGRAAEAVWSAAPSSATRCVAVCAERLAQPHVVGGHHSRRFPPRVQAEARVADGEGSR